MIIDNFLDTTLPENISKYQNNLKILIEEAKKNGKIDNFRLIRNDNFFPDDWKWIESSRNTGLEKKSSYLTSEIRKSLAFESRAKKKDDNLFGIPMPVSNDEMQELLKNIPEDAGLIMMPVRYRSTKHFTVNTPLAYTGDYNQVTLERNFHIIDKMDNFLNSEYAYSIDFLDAYLDVSHEGLDISEDAVVLISKEKYKEIEKNDDIKRQLNNRRIIVFEGDESLAINMVLTEMGVLPYRPGKYMIYDDSVLNILEGSIQDMCQQYNIGYHLSHGNIDGKGGHFSDLYDKYNHEYLIFEEEFINFLRGELPEYSDLITPNLFSNNSVSYNIVKNIPLTKLLEAINKYNEYAFKNFQQRYQKYKLERSLVTEETSLIFKNTIKLIIEYFNSGEILNISSEERLIINNLIRQFYHSSAVEEQLSAALALTEKLYIYNANIVDKNR